MTAAQEPLLSALMAIALTVGACSPPAGHSSQNSGENRDREIMDSELDANGIKAFLTGKEMRAANGTTGDPSYQRFFSDGTWEALAYEIEIVRREGRWEVRSDAQSRNQLCVTVIEQNGRESDRMPVKCFGIEVNRLQMVGKLMPIEDSSAGISVKFREFSGNDNLGMENLKAFLNGKSFEPVNTENSDIIVESFDQAGKWRAQLSGFDPIIKTGTWAVRRTDSKIPKVCVTVVKSNAKIVNNRPICRRIEIIDENSALIENLAINGFLHEVRRRVPWVLPERF